MGCFILGMLLTPPDVISQLLLAIPMWLLFEVGIVMGKLVQSERGKGSVDDSAGDSNEASE